MKKIIRYLILFCFSLIITNYLTHNLYFDQTAKSYLLVSLILTLFEIVLKPIIKILLLPVTLLTLGLFRSVIETIGLYLAVFLLPNFSVGNIFFPQTTFLGIHIQDISLTGFWAYLATSFIISLVFYIFSKLLTIKIHQ